MYPERTHNLVFVELILYGLCHRWCISLDSLHSSLVFKFHAIFRSLSFILRYSSNSTKVNALCLLRFFLFYVRNELTTFPSEKDCLLCRMRASEREQFCDNYFPCNFMELNGRTCLFFHFYPIEDGKFTELLSLDVVFVGK